MPLGDVARIGSAHTRRRHAHQTLVASAHPPASGSVTGHVTAAPAPPLPAMPEVGNPSKVNGAWSVDAARAADDARRVLQSIDWSKPDIVIWIPGTGEHDMDPAFRDAAEDSYKDGTASIAYLRYAASTDLHTSVPTGIATLKLVLEGIAAHGGVHRVLIAGQDQGAWIAGEVLADPAMRRVVDRTVLLGHPAAAAHSYADGRDAGVLQINDPHDAAATGKRGTSALYDVARSLPYLEKLLKDPHDYSLEMTRAIEFLRFGRTTGGQDLAPVNAVAVAVQSVARAPHGDAAAADAKRRTAALATYSAGRFAA